MSALAKVFVVIVLILAVGFTGTTATLYTARQDWKQAATKNIEEHKKHADEWFAMKSDMTATIEREKSNNTQLTLELAQLRTANEGVVRDNSQLKSDLAKTQQELKTAGDRNNEKDGYLRERDNEISRLSKANEELIARTKKAEESEKAALLHASRRDLDNEQLSKQLADTNIEFASLKKVSDDNASTIGRFKEQYPDQYERIAIQKPAPPIDGMVLAVHPEENIVVLSVGTQDKVESGYAFVVYRGDQYIGKVQTTKVAADMSGARILYLDGNQKIQKGDLVTTKIGQ